MKKDRKKDQTFLKQILFVIFERDGPKCFDTPSVTCLTVIKHLLEVKWNAVKSPYYSDLDTFY